MLCNDQFGFHPGRSTEDQLILMNNSISDALEPGDNVDLVLFYFSKAFDAVCFNTSSYREKQQQNQFKNERPVFHPLSWPRYTLVSTFAHPSDILSPFARIHQHFCSFIPLTNRLQNLLTVCDSSLQLTNLQELSIRTPLPTNWIICYPNC